MMILGGMVLLRKNNYTNNYKNNYKNKQDGVRGNLGFPAM
jgi:hypothetical protein